MKAMLDECNEQGILHNLIKLPSIKEKANQSGEKNRKKRNDYSGELECYADCDRFDFFIFHMCCTHLCSEFSKRQRHSLLSKLGFTDNGREGKKKSNRPKEKVQGDLFKKVATSKISAINLARQQPKSKKEENALQKKYGRLEPKERAYQILLDLGMIIEHPDPDSSNYDSSFDNDFVPFGEWV
jgi:hypothetical protein